MARQSRRERASSLSPTSASGKRKTRKRARFEHIQLWIRAIAAISFIFFGLWTIRGDKLDGEDNKKTRFGPVITVAIAFFLAEMGDKTQLATVALAAKYNDLIPVWMGTTAGMMVANAFGILVGVTLGKKIPEKAVKWFSAVIFIFFGFVHSRHQLIQI